MVLKSRNPCQSKDFRVVLPPLKASCNEPFRKRESLQKYKNFENQQVWQPRIFGFNQTEDAVHGSGTYFYKTTIKYLGDDPAGIGRDMELQFKEYPDGKIHFYFIKFI